MSEQIDPATLTGKTIAAAEAVTAEGFGDMWSSVTLRFTDGTVAWLLAIPGQSEAALLAEYSDPSASEDGPSA